MPYGMPGGDTKEKDSWMERCVDSVMKGGKDKGSAVAICKVTYQKKSKKAKSDISMEQELEEVRNKLNNAIKPKIDVPESVNGSWLVEVFDEYFIVMQNGNFYKVNYEWEGDDDNLMIDWNSAVKVDKVTSYEPCDETSEVKPKAVNRRITYGGLVR
jgi:hypothetical protein